METLEGYLASEYLADRQELDDVDRALTDVVSTFSTVFKGRVWPYEYQTSKTQIQEPEVSQGTVAMVLIATGRILGRCRRPKGTFGGLKAGDLSKLESNWELALRALLTNLSRKRRVSSTTFGDDNPVTLSHVSELAATLASSKKLLEARNKLLARSENAKNELIKLLGHDQPSAKHPLLVPPEERMHYNSNAFVVLRAIRAARDLELPTGLKTRHRRFFESTLHEQLSFSTIPDSRFDPAELIFCVEGALLCAPQTVDASLLDRVLEVLRNNQNSSAHWRPNKPFIASETGSIMLPLSVEGANSLMRSIAIMDEDRPYDTFTAKALPLIQRFWHWLRARSVRFERSNRQCLGWHSEHVNKPDLIHIWDTSQVAEFLIAYREMLERQIAAQSLQFSHLNVKRTKLTEKESRSPAEKRWKETIEDCEPLLDAKDDVPVQVYVELYKDFVKPWAAGNPRNYSMLLYGPPGTGKTTVAEKLAEVFGMPLITVTVSDFLGTGGANVEARAKAIFQALEAQERCVILFDEIDSFLLDRDTRLYRQQDSLFRFLTPGMLTKINDLRRAKRSIFIIATNYKDHIDPAIRRKGRIDQQYLLPLPNAKRRLQTMQKYGLAKIKRRERSSLIKGTAFFGFSDLKNATESAGKKMPREILSTLRSQGQPLSLDAFLDHCLKEEKFPAEELLSLVALAENAGLKDKVAALRKRLSKEKSRVRDQRVLEQLEKAKLLRADHAKK